MKNLRPTVIDALEANVTLVNLIGRDSKNEPKVYFQIAPPEVTAPYVNISEVTNFDSDFADNTAIASEIHMQVSVFSLDDTAAIAEQVDIAMKSIGFGRTSATDLYERDTKLHHKAMRYSIKTEL